MSQKTIQITGPFITNYSYARVNRGLALALSAFQQEYDVKVFREKEKIDKWPTESDFKIFPAVKPLWLEEKQHVQAAIINDFPKEGIVPFQIKDIDADIKIMYIAWEETIYPAIWVDEINQNAHAVMAASHFVKDILTRNGIKIPIAVIPNAIDDRQRLSPTGDYPLKNSKAFKFFHLSTAKKRKGVDVLIKAYAKAFTKDDNVALVIKSSPGPDNQVQQLIQEFCSQPDSPVIEHISDATLSDQDIVNLMHSCNAAVYPSRAEGFGLPIAEAMFHGLPVIATGYSAQMDFFNDKNGFVLDYTLEKAVESDLGLAGSYWAEPSDQHLQQLLKELYEGYDLNKKIYKNPKILEKIMHAKLDTQQLTWEYSASKTIDFVRKVEGLEKLKQKKCAHITPLNSKDGIAVYVQNVFFNIQNSFEDYVFISNSDIADRALDDAPNVQRLWEMGGTDMSKVVEYIKNNTIEIVHIQYHSGSYFSVEVLDSLLQNLIDLNCEIYVTLHAARGKNFDIIAESKNLTQVNKVIILNSEDAQYAKETLANIEEMRLPNLTYPFRRKESLIESLGFSENTPIIITHGLFNSNKNILSVIQSIEILKREYPHIKLLCANAVTSNNSVAFAEYEKCKEYVHSHQLENNVLFFTDFLHQDVIEVLMQVGDVNVLAYTEVGESASDAVRKCLASKHPTVVTDIKMMSEFTNEVYKIKSAEPQLIANAIKALLTDNILYSQTVNAMEEYLEKNTILNAQLRHLGMYSK